MVSGLNADVLVEEVGDLDRRGVRTIIEALGTLLLAEALLEGAAAELEADLPALLSRDERAAGDDQEGGQ